MAKKKNVDPQAKAKRQKIILACLAPVLLGLMAFQIPRTLKMMHQQNANAAASSTPAATTPTPATTTSLAPPTLGGGAAGSAAGGATGATGATAAAKSADGIVDPSASSAGGANQLITFDRFRTKDPFIQQVENCNTGCDSSTGASTSTPVVKPTKKTVPATPPAGTGAHGNATAPTTTTPTTPQKLTTATISVNGVSEQVSVGKPFPAADPVFVLVSLARNAVKISIAGGTLESGAPTVTLEKGKPLTLVNTADGTQYELRLVATA